jgi:hypothetical protein
MDHIEELSLREAECIYRLVKYKQWRLKSYISCIICEWKVYDYAKKLK